MCSDRLGHKVGDPPDRVPPDELYRVTRWLYGPSILWWGSAKDAADDAAFCAEQGYTSELAITAYPSGRVLLGDDLKHLEVHTPRTFAVPLLTPPPVHAIDMHEVAFVVGVAAK